MIFILAGYLYYILSFSYYRPDNYPTDLNRFPNYFFSSSFSSPRFFPYFPNFLTKEGECCYMPFVFPLNPVGVFYSKGVWDGLRGKKGSFFLVLTISRDINTLFFCFTPSLEQGRSRTDRWGPCFGRVTAQYKGLEP